MASEAIVRIEEPENQNHEPTPMGMIQLAVQRGADINTIERLVALQEKMLAREAETQFNEAMSRVQSALGPVAADLTNPLTKSQYASYAALDRKVRPIYSREGFSLSFDTGDSPAAEMVRVLCYVSRGGHTRQYKVDMPADGKGAKGGDVMTKTHATGAAMSYGMRYLLKYVFNIAVGEDDNDGNGVMSDLTERIEWIQNARNNDELKHLFTKAYQDASQLKDKNAQHRLIEAKDARKKELQ